MVVNILISLLISGASNACADDGIVCSYASNDCAIYTVSDAEKRRILIDCAKRTLINTFVSKNAVFDIHQNEINVKDIGADKLQINIANKTEIAEMTGYWAGAIDNIFIVAGVMSEQRFIRHAKAGVCSHVAKIKSGISSGQYKACMGKPIFFFVADGHVGALDGKYWLNSDGSMKH